MITRVKAVQNLRKYIGSDLAELAAANGVTVFKGGKQNKGWKGLTLELLAGLLNENLQALNGLRFELKSVAFKKLKNGQIVPKETMAITMINPESLIATPFYESHCWEKLKSLVLCAVLWEGTNDITSEVLDIKSFDFLEDGDLIRQIESDYEFIRQKLTDKGFDSLTGKDGVWIQARTKGAGYGSTSRAFYARKSLVSRIFE